MLFRGGTVAQNTLSQDISQARGMPGFDISVSMNEEQGPWKEKNREFNLICGDDLSLLGSINYARSTGRAQK